MSETDTQLFGVLVEGRPLQPGEAIGLSKEYAAFLRREHHRPGEALAQANVLIVVEIASALGLAGLPAFVGLIRPVEIEERLAANQIQIERAARGDYRADFEFSRDRLEGLELPPRAHPELPELRGRHEKLRGHVV